MSAQDKCQGDSRTKQRLEGGENISNLRPNPQVLELVKLDIILGARFFFTARYQRDFVI